MTPARRERLVSGAGISLLAAATGYQITCVFSSATFINAFLMFQDDAYYYLMVARNIATTGISTFDGIHRTTGVQLLWTWCLVPLAWLFEGRAELVRAVLLLSTALNLVSGILLYRLGRQLHSTALGAVAAIGWAGLMVTLRPMMQGMEYPIHVPIIVLTIGACSRLFLEKTPPPRGFLVWLGVLFTLNYWARLDSAVIAVVCWIGAGVLLRWRGAVPAQVTRSLTLMALAPTVGAIGYVWLCHFMGGTLIPISGSVKSFYASQFFEGESPLFRAVYAGGVLLTTEAAIIRTVTSAGTLMRTAFSDPLLLVYWLLLAWGGIWLLRRHPVSGQSAASRLTAFLLVMLTVVHVHLLVLVWTLAHFARYTQHYYGWLIVLWLLCTSLLLAELLQSLPARRFVPIVGAALLVFGALEVRFLATNRLPPQEGLRHEDAVAEAARFVNRELPADAVIGSWNAGQLAYLSGRRVINLDGLANDAAFFELLRQQVSLCDYFEQERIRYLVDINARDMSMRRRFSWDPALSFRGMFPRSDLRLLQTIGDVEIFEIVACPIRPVKAAG